MIYPWKDGIVAMQFIVMYLVKLDVPTIDVPQHIVI